MVRFGNCGQFAATIAIAAMMTPMPQAITITRVLTRQS
jgi:hypothetical protein